MPRLTLRLTDELHEKLRWLSYTKRVSQHSIVLELLEKRLQKVEVPDEARESKRG
jgi:predicted DNA-binding protein